MSNEALNSDKRRPVVVVTGAGGDLGSQIATTLSATYDVVCLGRTKESLDRTSSNLLPGNHSTIVTDISDNDSIEQAIHEVTSTYAHIDLLINNAVLFDDPKLLHQRTNEEISALAQTNMAGTMLVTKAVLQNMLHQSAGTIINIGSTAAFEKYPLRDAYSWVKSGEIKWTETLAAEYKKYGISCFYLCPGPTEGPRVDDIIQKRSRATNKPLDELREKFAAINGGALLDPQQVTQAIESLLAESWEQITGGTFGIDRYGIFVQSGLPILQKNLPKKTLVKGLPRAYYYLWNTSTSTFKRQEIMSMCTQLLYKKIPLRAAALRMGTLLALLGGVISSDTSNIPTDKLLDIEVTENHRALALARHGVSKENYSGTDNYFVLEIIEDEAYRIAVKEHTGFEIKSIWEE